MKNLKPIGKTTVIMLLLALAFVCKSCKKEESTPSYVGTWSATVTYFGEAPFPAKYIMTLTKDSFNYTEQEKYYLDTSMWIDDLKIYGSSAMHGNTIKFTISQFGLPSYDSFDHYQGLIMYKQGDRLFDVKINETRHQKTFHSAYSISGNKMTIKTDSSILYASRTIIYTRQ